MYCRLTNGRSASFRAHLDDPSIEFVFVDGPNPSAPAPGIDLFYQPPYFSFANKNTLAATRASAAWLADHLAQAGPYDAVMGFSQGCYVASSFLLLHSVDHPDEPPPFKAAIFICGGPSLLLAEDLGFRIPAEVWERERAAREALFAQADSSAILAKGSERWTGLGVGSGGVSEEEIRRDLQGPYSIDIPTVHIYGNKDPRYTSGVMLSGLCDDDKRRVFDHEGGHEIPRSEAVSREIARLVRWALHQAG